MERPEETLRRYASAPAAEKAALIGRVIEDGALCGLYALLGRAGGRAALRMLADAARKKNAAAALRDLERENGHIARLLRDKDPKARKNAAQLIGACCAADLAETLLQAARDEDTEYVRPSLLLALGRTGSDAAHTFLRDYTLKNTVEKHWRLESAALKKALSALRPGADALRTPDVTGFAVLLAAPVGHADLTQEELDEHGLPYGPSSLRDMLRVRPPDYASLFACRTFAEALIVLGQCKNDEQGLSSYLRNPKFGAAITRLYGGDAIRYRIEVRGARSQELRRRIIDAALSCIDAPHLRNSPSGYDFELRLMMEKTHVHVLVKPSAALDRRFSYRLRTLPASIHPVTAAALMRYAYPYLKRDAHVLDPFCGSGTLLFERAFVKPCKSLMGIDRDRRAADCFAQNEQAARTGAAFILSDILDYAPDRQHDEAVSNMPFGLRVGSHAGNEALYAAFLQKLKSLLKDGGMAFLFTHDKTLFRHAVDQAGGFNLVDEAVFEAGKLHPSLFILKKNEKGKP